MYSSSVWILHLLTMLAGGWRRASTWSEAITSCALWNACMSTHSKLAISNFNSQSSNIGLAWVAACGFKHSKSQYTASVTYRIRTRQCIHSPFFRYMFLLAGSTIWHACLRLCLLQQFVLFYKSAHHTVSGHSIQVYFAVVHNKQAYFLTNGASASASFNKSTLSPTAEQHNELYRQTTRRLYSERQRSILSVSAKTTTAYHDIPLLYALMTLVVHVA